jgi:tetratricopeptide (TPR) repeat protein
VEEAVRSALVIVTCLIAAACSATGPDPRPLESGFGPEAGVADPYEDGKQHLAASRYDLAAQRFGQALANDRRSLDALNGLAIAYSRLGRFDIAQAYFERALQVDGTSAMTLNNYGWSLIEQRRLRDAKPFLELALHHAAETDVPVIAGNIESMKHAKPPALIAALESNSRPERVSRHRIIRLATNRHRLETIVGPVGWPELATVPDGTALPAVALWQSSAAVASPEQVRSRADATSHSFVMAGRDGADGSAQASTEHSGVAESNLDLPVNSYDGDAPIEIRPESEAAAILAGERP